MPADSVASPVATPEDQRSRTVRRVVTVLALAAVLPALYLPGLVHDFFDLKIYMRAMAELGPGPHRSGDIAERLGRKVTSLGPTRSQLIEKGMIWSPNHGDTAFTVPLFDEFMRRIMPGDAWRST